MSSATTLAQQPTAAGPAAALAGLTIVQLNCNKRKEVSPDLARLMIERKWDVALLQEHSVQPTGLPAGFPRGMRTFGCSGRGRNLAAIVVNNPDIEVVPMDTLTNEHGTCIWTKGNYGELVVCSMYCKHNVPLTPYFQYMEAVQEAAGDTPLLIGMDANARSPLWHSKVRPNARGQRNYGIREAQFEQLIVSRGFVVLNEPSVHYTFCGPAGQSDIDVMMGNAAMRRFAVSWSVLPRELTSDHNILRAGLTIDRANVAGQEANARPVARWSSSGADWPAFRQQVSMAGARIDAQGLTAEEMQREVARILTAACDMCLKKEQVQKARRQLWWSAELAEMRRQVRRARVSYQLARRGTIRGTALTPHVMETRRLYRQQERAYSNRIQEEKAKDWRRFVSEDGNSNPWGAVYRICRGKAATSIGSLRTPTGVTKTWEEAVDVLLGSFHPARDVNELAFDDVQLEEPTPVTEEEIQLAVLRCKARRAPGLDGMRADVVKHAFAAAPKLILDLFNKCLSEGCFPVAWKTGHVVAFLKSQDKDRSEPKSYRPITLLPVIGKVFERVCVERLRKVVQQQPTQFGFTSGKSTIDAWLQAMNLAKESPAKYLLGVFVDFRGAFDHLNWEPIVRKLGAIGCKELPFWRSYFSGRRSCMVGLQDVVWRTVERGCPQGSICGPAIWNVMMDDLLLTLAERGIRHVAYADDLLIIVEGRSRTVLEEAAVQALQLAADWGGRVGVDISFTKTEAMMLRGRFDAGRMPIIRIGAEQVQIVQMVKYLGVWVSDGLRFHGHLREIKKKLLRVVAPLKRVLRQSWGLKRKAALAWVKGLLMPVALYGAPVWYQSARTAPGRKSLDSAQRVSLYFLRTCRTVSTEAMQVLAGALPWDLAALRLAMRYKYRRGLTLLATDLLTEEEAAGAQALKLIDERVNDEWQRRWTTSEKGRVTHAFIPSVGATTHEFDPPTRCAFILTGHGSMNAYLQKHTGAESAECGCGYAREDWSHILASCPRYDDLRDLRRMRVTIVDQQIDVSLVLSSRDSFEALVEFAQMAFIRRALLVVR